MKKYVWLKSHGDLILNSSACTLICPMWLHQTPIIFRQVIISIGGNSWVGCCHLIPFNLIYHEKNVGTSNRSTLYGINLYLTTELRNLFFYLVLWFFNWFFIFIFWEGVVFVVEAHPAPFICQMHRFFFFWVLGVGR